MNCNNTFLGRLFSLESLEDPVIKAVERMDFEESEFLAVFTPSRQRSPHHGQIDLNTMLKTAKGTHQTSKWIPLGPKKLKTKILHGRNLGEIIRKVNFGEIPGFEPSTFRLRDQHATTALSFGLRRMGRKVVFINTRCIFVKRM